MLNSEERIIRTLKHEEVDRVPTYEWTIDKKVIDLISPGLSYEEFVYFVDLDAICISIDFKLQRIDAEIYQDEWGIFYRFNKEQHPVSVNGCIKTLNDFNNYVPPEMHKPERFNTIETIVEKHRGKKAIIVHLNDVVSIPRNLMGYEHFLISVIENPGLVKQLVKLSVDLNLELAKELVKRGVKIVYTGDDFAFNNGLIFPLKTFEDIFYPEFLRLVTGFKEQGLFVIKHTDGNIIKILDLLANSGIDCLDPIDPLAGMDIEYVKNTYGKKIAIKGNIDCANLLSFETVDKVIFETKKCIDKAAKDGGFILSSSNSIHTAVKPENYIAMLWTLRTYGNYF